MLDKGSGGSFQLFPTHSHNTQTTSTKAATDLDKTSSAMLFR